MQVSLCSDGYSDFRPNWPTADFTTASDWVRLLPGEWRSQAEEPVDFEVFREYEMAAARVVGRNESGRPCYCAHNVEIPEWRTDDDEEFFSVIAYAEELHAWRLNDGRWLVHRVVQRGDACQEPGSGAYSFAEAMPR